MASLNRIVLVDTLGDELFSGSSMLSEPPHEKDEEPCPETLRSSVFVRVHDTVEPEIEVTIDDFDVEEHDNRAA